MNPLPLVLSIALLTGCTRIIPHDPVEHVTCTGKRCVGEKNGWSRNISWEETEEGRAEAKAKVDRQYQKAKAWNDAHPEEYARQLQRAIQYEDSKPRNVYGCPGTQVPMTWAPWWGPNACAQRTW